MAPELRLATWVGLDQVVDVHLRRLAPQHPARASSVLFLGRALTRRGRLAPVVDARELAPDVIDAPDGGYAEDSVVSKRTMSSKLSSRQSTRPSKIARAASSSCYCPLGGGAMPDLELADASTAAAVEGTAEGGGEDGTVGGMGREGPRRPTDSCRSTAMSVDRATDDTAEGSCCTSVPHSSSVGASEADGLALASHGGRAASPGALDGVLMGDPTRQTSDVVEAHRVSLAELGTPSAPPAPPPLPEASDAARHEPPPKMRSFLEEVREVARARRASIESLEQREMLLVIRCRAVSGELQTLSLGSQDDASLQRWCVRARVVHDAAPFGHPALPA